MARKPAAIDDSEGTEVQIREIVQGSLTLALIGTTPFISHAMAAKAQRELLLPSGGKKTAADRAATPKHDPISEYRDSTLRSSDDPNLRMPGDTGETRILLPASAVKKCIGTAALDMPGAKKSEVGRLCWINGYNLPLWGIPQIYMTTVRNSDIRHTPDIRTRAALPQWATLFTINWVQGKLNPQSLINLFAGGGLTCGLGDGRQEKGALNFGSFRVAMPNDPEFAMIRQMGGRAAQDAALAEPGFFDAQSQELFTWFQTETIRRQGRKTIRSTAIDQQPEGIA